MLILTRRVGETIRIGDDIHITVLGIKGHQVRLGITAPSDVSVHREEIYLRIKAEERIRASVEQAEAQASTDQEDEATKGE